MVIGFVSHVADTGGDSAPLGSEQEWPWPFLCAARGLVANVQF